MDDRIKIFFPRGNDLRRLRDSFTDSRVIAISGNHYAGKTTLAKGLAKETGMKMHSLGEFFREFAAERDVPIEYLPFYLKERPNLAKAVDTASSRMAMERMAKGEPEGLVVDGGISGWYSLMLEGLGRKNMARVYLGCSKPTACERLLKVYDDGDLVDMHMRRDVMDTDRYEEEFGFRETEQGIYGNHDLVIWTDSRTPEDVLDLVLSFYRNGLSTD